MSSETLTPDGNTRNIAGAVTDDSNAFIKKLRIDDTTKGLKVMLIGGTGAGTVTEVDTGTGLTGGPITGTGTIALDAKLAPLDTLGTALQQIRVNAGATALEYFTASAGSGTVTTVSVVTANGVSGSVATATTTPAITLTLGAITPTTVNGNTFTTGSSTYTGTAGQTYTFPSTSATIARTDAANTFTGVQTMTSPVFNTGLSGTAFGTGVATFITTPSSANLAAAITDETGTGVVVFATSPTLITPNLGTPTTLVGTNITGTGASFTSGITQALASATTTVNVSSATAPINGQVLTATSGTAATWQTPSSTIPTTKECTSFEALTRFTATQTGGSTTLGTQGALINATSTTSRFAQLACNNQATFFPYSGSPIFTTEIEFAPQGLGTTGAYYMGIGTPTIATTGITFTPTHIGFKVLVVSGVASLYATQADGTTENASSVLTTLLTGDMLRLIVKVNGASSVDYYYSKNTSASYSTVNLTTNMPSTSLQDAMWIFGCTNSSSASAQSIYALSASFER